MWFVLDWQTIATKFLMVVKKWHRRLELLYYVCFFPLQCSEMYCACLVVTTVCFSSVLIPEKDYHVRFCIYYICIKYCWLEYYMPFLFEKDMLHKMTPCLELQLLPCVLQWIMLIQLDYVYDFDRYGPLSYSFLHLVCIAPIICFSTFFLGLQIATVLPLFATGGAAWCVIPDYGCEWKTL